MAKLTLSPSQTTRLSHAVKDEFPSAQFAEFVLYQLREFLDLITVKKYPANIADVIDWAEGRSRTAELLRKLHDARPASREIHAIWQEFRGHLVETLHGAFPSSDTGDLESIVLRSVQFQDVNKWLDRMARIRQAVCRIEPQPQTDSEESLDGYATGFLVGPSTVLTNFHVAQNLLANGKAARTRIRFGYEITSEDKTEWGQVYALADQWLLASSPVEDLDYALLRLAPPPDRPSAVSEPRRFLQLKDHLFARDEPLIILQHPSAKPLKLAFGVVVNPTDGLRVAYKVNTEHGSSGSPCLTSSLDTVALHHWGGPNDNRGVRLGPILEHLKESGKSALLAPNGGL
jgi:hypothetical protein